MSDTRPRRLADHLRRHSVAYAALAGVIALSPVPSIAAAVVTSADIKNDTIRPIDLAFATGQEAEIQGVDDIALGSGFTKVLSATYSNDDSGGLATGYGLVEVDNPTDKEISVTVRLQHIGEPSHTTQFTSTVGPHETESAPASILCNAFPSGLQTITMSVSGEGATITDSTLTMIAAPQR